MTKSKKGLSLFLAIALAVSVLTIGLVALAAGTGETPPGYTKDFSKDYVTSKVIPEVSGLLDPLVGQALGMLNDELIGTLSLLIMPMLIKYDAAKADNEEILNNYIALAEYAPIVLEKAGLAIPDFATKFADAKTPAPKKALFELVLAKNVLVIGKNDADENVMLLTPEATAKISAAVYGVTDMTSFASVGTSVLAGLVEGIFDNLKISEAITGDFIKTLVSSIVTQVIDPLNFVFNYDIVPSSFADDLAAAFKKDRADVKIHKRAAPSPCSWTTALLKPLLSNAAVILNDVAKDPTGKIMSLLPNLANFIAGEAMIEGYDNPPTLKNILDALVPILEIALSEVVSSDVDTGDISIKLSSLIEGAEDIFLKVVKEQSIRNNKVMVDTYDLTTVINKYLPTIFEAIFGITPDPAPVTFEGGTEPTAPPAFDLTGVDYKNIKLPDMNAMLLLLGRRGTEVSSTNTASVRAGVTNKVVKADVAAVLTTLVDYVDKAFFSGATAANKTARTTLIKNNAALIFPDEGLRALVLEAIEKPDLKAATFLYGIIEYAEETTTESTTETATGTTTEATTGTTTEATTASSTTTTTAPSTTTTAPTTTTTAPTTTTTKATTTPTAPTTTTTKATTTTAPTTTTTRATTTTTAPTTTTTRATTTTTAPTTTTAEATTRMVVEPTTTVADNSTTADSDTTTTTDSKGGVIGQEKGTPSTGDKIITVVLGLTAAASAAFVFSRRRNK